MVGRRFASIWLVAFIGAPIACSAELIGTASDEPADGGGGVDAPTAPPEAGVDAAVDAGFDAPPPARCTSTSPIVDVVPLVLLGAEEGKNDRHPTLNAAETELFFASTRAAQGRYPTIYRATRASPSAPFDEPTPGVPLLVPPGQELADSHASLSVDGLSLVFATKRKTTFDLWIARRSAPNIAFDTIDPVTSGINDDTLDENSPTIDVFGNLWFARTVLVNGVGGSRQAIFRASPKVGSPSWENAIEITSLNDLNFSTGKPVLSADGLTLYFSTNRANPGSLGDYDIWTATRTAVTSEFTNLTPVTGLTTTEYEVPGWLSPDGCRLYFDRGTPKGARVFVAIRKP